MWARGGLSGGGSCGERAAACGRRAYVPYPAVTALALAALAAATAARARRLEYRNRAQVPDPHDQATDTGEMSHFDSRLDMSRRTCARLVMAHVLCSKCRFYGEARVQERKQKLLSIGIWNPCVVLSPRRAEPLHSRPLQSGKFGSGAPPPHLLPFLVNDSSGRRKSSTRSNVLEAPGSSS